MDKIVETLQVKNHHCAAWMAAVKKSKEPHDHLREEGTIFSTGRKILNDRQEAMLARKYRLEFRRMQERLTSE